MMMIDPYQSNINHPPPRVERVEGEVYNIHIKILSFRSSPTRTGLRIPLQQQVGCFERSLPAITA